MGWPDVLAHLLVEIEPGDTVIPGHGAVTGRAFVVAQYRYLARTAARSQDSWDAGLTIEKAVASGHGGFPWPTPILRSVLKHGYAQLTKL